MKSQDLVSQRADIRTKLQEAFKAEDNKAFYEAFDAMCENIGESVKAEYQQKIEEMREDFDSRILATRGVRQLTSGEKKYFEDVITAMKSADPRQALTNVGSTMPVTVIESVFDDLRTEHPLLSRINFIPTGGAVRWVVSADGSQKATWGALCDEIIKELSAGFRVVDTNLKKLSAFMPVCEAMLELGPEWLDQYVREILYESIANGLEYGIVAGTGKDEPIGMNRQVGDDVTVTAGVYPEKEAIAISDFGIRSLGQAISLLTITGTGKTRRVDDLILIVNPTDYYTIVAPATKMLTANGTYVDGVLPFPVEIYQSVYVDSGTAILGSAKRYKAFIGTEKGGRIETSDECHFLEDERVYKIKLFGNGSATDDNSFVVLDISGVQPLANRVVVVDERDPSDNALLSNLRLSGITLSPVFDADEDTYTAATTVAGTVVSAWPADAAATIAIDHDGAAVNNGDAIVFTTGANVITITVTAEDGTTEEEYTVTVTKS